MASEEIYETQQFGQKIGLGQRPVLLVVDLVNGFADPQILGGGNIRDAIAATVPLLSFFRERQFPVIFTRIVYAEDGSDAGVWCEKAPRLRRTRRICSIWARNMPTFSRSRKFWPR